jgi:hypothetical protein
MQLWEPKRKCPKPVARHLRHHVVRSWTLECNVKSYVTGPSTKCYFNKFLFMQTLTHDTIEYINGCELSECHSLLVLCEAYLQEMVFENGPSDHEAWSIWCHVENSCRLYIHLSIHKLRWSLKHSVKRTWTGSADSTNESAWSVIMVTGSQSRVWSGP